MANEQLEHLRNEIQRLEDERGALRQLAAGHFPKLFALTDAIAEVFPKEARTDALVGNVHVFKVELADANDKDLYRVTHFMDLVDTVCRIRHLTNTNKVRQLIDLYEGGWTA